jgi:copper chaperone CopZ
MKRIVVSLVAFGVALGAVVLAADTSYGFLWFGKSAKTERATFNVQGMTCAGCEDAITGALAKIDGVRCAKADHEAGTAEVCFKTKKTDVEALGAAITEAGFAATLVSSVECDPDACKGRAEGAGCAMKNAAGQPEDDSAGRGCAAGTSAAGCPRAGGAKAGCAKADASTCAPSCPHATAPRCGGAHGQKS